MIPPRTRAQLINDAFILSQVGFNGIFATVSPTRPFEIIRFLSTETDPLPWGTTLTRLGYVTSMLDSTVAFGDYENYVLQLITTIYNGLGWTENESDTWLER